MRGTIVALETSARRASVAAQNGERALFAELASERAHASDLLPALDRLLRELHAPPAEIRAVLVGTGPGSYTGLRVGIATAIGLARGSGAVLRGVPSCETLAFGALAPGEEAVTLIDARQGELYFAHYRRVEDEILVLRAPCVLTPEEVRAALPAGVAIFGDEDAALAAGSSATDRTRLHIDASPKASTLLALGALRLDRLGPQPASDVEPLYLRPFAAKSRRR